MLPRNADLPESHSEGDIHRKGSDATARDKKRQPDYPRMASEPRDELQKERILEEAEVVPEDDAPHAEEKAGHTFYLHTFKAATFCNFCQDFVWGIRRQAFKCVGCSYVVHYPCKEKVDTHCPHLEYFHDPEEPDVVQFKHNWVPGNTYNKKCIFCGKSTRTLPPRGGFDSTCHCGTCRAAAHNDCLASASRDHPNNKCRPPLRNSMFCSELLEMETPPKDYKPLLVFVNHKSGGQQGAEVLKDLRQHLTPSQVISLIEEDPPGPGAGLTKYGKKPQMRLLVCGGDGTAGWVLQEMMDRRDDFRDRDWVPPMAVLPLGTGNDLARVLNWGGGYTFTDDLGQILQNIEENSVTSGLDRWQVQLVPSEGSKDYEIKKFVLNNYFSIGLDAQIALQFHNMRESNPSLFKSRTLNKGIYGLYGMQKIVAVPPVISDFGVNVTVDGKDIPPDALQKIQCIVWQNIPSYGGGSVLWGDYNPELEPHITPCVMDDGVLEVVGLKDITHVIGIQTSVQSGQKLAQGANFHITVASECPIQVDGEPFLVGPCQIIISQMNTAVMLAKK